MATMTRLHRLLPVLTVLVMLSIGAPRSLGIGRTPGNCWIKDVAAPGDDSLWLLCERGDIYQTFDEGATWSVIKVGEIKAHALAFIDARRVFVAGANGMLMASMDGGKSWRQIETDIKSHLNDIVFVGELGWAVGSSGTILHSIDGGLSWGQRKVPTMSNLETVHFLDPKHGWVVGWGGAVLRTVDGGGFWEPITAEEFPYVLTSVSFRDSMNGWAVGVPSTIVRTSDGGLTWTRQPCPSNGWLSSIRFTEDGKGYIAGDQVLVSNDGGDSWKILPLNGVESIREMAVQNGRLWIVGPNTVAVSSNGGTAWELLESSPFMTSNDSS